MKLLPATAAEHGALAALIAASHRDVAERFGLNAGNCPNHASACTPQWLADETARGQRYLVARVAGETVGCVAVDFPAEGESLHLNRLSVLPAWRRRGIGEALTRAVLEVAAHYGVGRVSIGIIAAHAELERWYARLGFVAGATRRFEHLPFQVRYMACTVPPASTPTLYETARLRCRRWRPDDVAALQAVYGDADAMRWAGDGRAITAAECEAWRRVTAINYATRGHGMFALEARDGSGVIGFCGLVHPGGQIEPEAKYALARQHWGQGLASEALQGLLAWAAARGLGPVIATVAEPNHASRRVLAKAGLHEVGRRDEDDGVPTLIYAAASGPSPA
ncbi:GNAT family N-acetyltransferase [Rubrivivax gelatinosus]|nr:GNAT family N-acetyltransferase [Rubrivivax gelatinosus]